MDRPGSGVRRLIGLLALLNLGVLLAGLGMGYWLGEPLLPREFNAGKIQLLESTRPEGTPGRGAGSTQVMAEVTAEGAPSGQGVVQAADCLAWPALNADQVGQVQGHMRRAGVADGDYDLQVAMRLGWWVFIPPLANAEALRVVMEDARAKGVRDMAPVTEGPMAHALALGIFPSLDGAHRHARDMAAKGLSAVAYGPRPGAGEVRLVVARESSRLLAVLAGDWPPGLKPGACGAP